MRVEQGWVGAFAAAIGVVAMAGVIAVIADGGDDATKRLAAMPGPYPAEAGDQADPALAPTPTPTPAQQATGSPAPPDEPVKELLLPNLQSLPPEDVLIEIVDGTRRLRFASIIANTGIGPVETIPDELLRCPDDQRHASQVIYHDADGDGQYDQAEDTTTTVRPAGCMLDHPDHEHWHFDAAARYALNEPGESAPAVSKEKVSFCWRDNREVPAEADPRPDQYYGDCSRDDVQGITPGWADVYSEKLDDQHLDLPDDLADGTYCLWNEADPLSLLREIDESDNAAVLTIEIAGGTVEEGTAAC